MSQPEDAPGSDTATPVAVTAEMQADAVESETERWLHIGFTWSGKPFSLDIAESDRCASSARPVLEPPSHWSLQYTNTQADPTILEYSISKQRYRA